jgi:hypothetical protein
VWQLDLDELGRVEHEQEGAPGPGVEDEREHHPGVLGGTAVGVPGEDRFTGPAARLGPRAGAAVLDVDLDQPVRERARITEQAFYALEAPVLRVGGFDTPYPPSRLEEDFLPDLDRVLDAVDRSLAF